MISVEVIGDIETAIRFLKKVVAKDGIHTQIKRRLAFVKPSEKRKAKAAIAERRKRELERKRRRFEERYYARPKRSSPQDLQQFTMAGEINITE